MKPNLTRHMICDSLGYCCEFAFFHIYADTETHLIADRLGVAMRTIQRHREAAGRCTNAENCMAAKRRG